jgi:hypothetical protein
MRTGAPAARVQRRSRSLQRDGSEGPEKREEQKKSGGPEFRGPKSGDPEFGDCESAGPELKSQTLHIRQL